MPHITISGKPYEYGTNEENSFGVYLWSLYDYAERNGLIYTCKRIQILYRRLDVNNQRWMMAVGFKPIPAKVRNKKVAALLTDKAA